jgi:hypothetical protein
MTVLGAPERVEFFAFFVAAIQAVVPRLHRSPDGSSTLALRAPGPPRLRDVLATAGLNDIRVETITEQLEFRSGTELWDWLVNSNPIAKEILAELELTDEQTTSVQEALDGMVRKRSAGTGPAVLTSPINIGIGTK